FFQAEDGIRDATVTGVQTCALPISISARFSRAKPAKLSSSASISVSKVCNREVRSSASIPDLFGADQPEGWVVAQPLGIVHILVSSQATVHRLPQQVGEGQARILRPRVRQVLLD